VIIVGHFHDNLLENKESQSHLDVNKRCIPGRKITFDEDDPNLSENNSNPVMVINGLFTRH